MQAQLVTEQACAELNNLTTAAAIHIHQLPNNDHSVRMLYTPLSEGGFGLQNATLSAPAAYASGWTKHYKENNLTKNPDVIHQETPHIHKLLACCVDRLSANGADEADIRDLLEQGTVAKPMTAWHHAMRSYQHQQNLMLYSPEQQVTVHAASGKGAGRRVVATTNQRKTHNAQ